jgi:hypothetical protein
MTHAVVYIVSVSSVKHLQWATRSLPKSPILTDYHSQWSKSGSLHELLYTVQIVGITAGFAMLVIFASALLLRKLQYETFHIIHILMAALILVTVGMHRPNLTQKTVFIIIFAAAIWVADRILRFLKFALYSVGNTATITPLIHGGTRIVLHRLELCLVSIASSGFQAFEQQSHIHLRSLLQILLSLSSLLMTALPATYMNKL